MSGILFTNVSVLDGSGAEPFAGEVLVVGNRIKAIGRDGAAVERGRPRGGRRRRRHADAGPDRVARAHQLLRHRLAGGSGRHAAEEHTLETMKYARLMLDQGFTALFSAAAASRG